jgi:hypothetical protein
MLQLIITPGVVCIAGICAARVYIKEKQYLQLGKQLIALGQERR